MLSEDGSQEITALLRTWRGGDENALSDLLPLVYRRLKKIAGHLMRGQRSGGSLETTALVHEGYLRLIDLERISWQDRTHFFAMSARIMRQVLVDQARYDSRVKRGGRAFRVETKELRNLHDERAPDLVALDDALTALAEVDEEKARLVELRFFGGLDRHELAEVLGISRTTVTRRWRAARAWLLHYLSSEEPS